MGKGTLNLTRHLSLTSVGMGSFSIPSVGMGTVSLASKGMGTVSLAMLA
jgi:hypothetical protein